MEEYKSKVILAIKEIVANVSMSTTGKLLDDGLSINDQLESLYNIGNFSDEEQKNILTNWIYYHYYQNRRNNGSNKIEPNTSFDLSSFPFAKEVNSYWRNRFWRYDDEDLKSDTGKIVLTHGFENRAVLPREFVEDELIFERDHKAYKYLSFIFPKFEIQGDQKFVFGCHPLDDDGQGGVIRFYFNLKAKNLTESIPAFINLFNQYFNDRLIPFYFKFWSKSTNFERADNLVLYLEQRHFFIAGILIKHIYMQLKDFLNTDCLPYFVYEVLPGIGFGKSPQKDELSFGVMRSELIAKEILEQITINSLSADADKIINIISEKWGMLDNFYVNPKPSFQYSFEVFEQSTFFTSYSFQNQAFEAAFSIAKLLCREAIWLSATTCNWIGYQEIESEQTEKKLGYRLLELNGGFAGIEGVFTFLEAFQKIGIRDSIIEFVCQSAINLWQSDTSSLRVINSDKDSKDSQNNIWLLNQQFKFTDFNFFKNSETKKYISPPEFKDKKSKKQLMGIIKGNASSDLKDFEFIKRVAAEHISIGRPLGNMIDGTDNFRPDLKFGLAGYGYALLRIYDPDKIPALYEEGIMI